MKHFYLFLFLIGGLIAETAEAQHFSFTPPENFIADTLNSGSANWFNKEAGSVIQITETTGTAFNTFKENFNEEQLTNNNLVIKEKKPAGPALLYICSYRTMAADGSRDVEFTRVIFFTGNANAVVMAVATIPAMAEPVLLEPIIQSFVKDLIIR